MADLRQRHGATDGFLAAVISRVIIHVDGAPGAGKTAFVERLLGVLDEWVLAVRCRRDQSLRQARESSSARDPEMRRYRAAGASDTGRFTFPSGRDVADAFFTGRLLTDISDVVVIEGDSPLPDADLRVFVAPPPAVGQTLLVRERRDRAAQQRARAAAMERLLGEPDGAARLLEQLVGGPVVALAREQPELLEQARASLVAGIGKVRTAPPPAPTEHWAIAGATRGSSMHSWSCSTRVRMRSGGVRRGGTLRIVAFRNRIWRPATNTAGLAGLRVHDLRHTAVALWIAASASPKEVAVRAGHTSVSFTLDRYGHLPRGGYQAAGPAR